MKKLLCPVCYGEVKKRFGGETKTPRHYMRIDGRREETADSGLPAVWYTFWCPVHGKVEPTYRDVCEVCGKVQPKAHKLGDGRWWVPGPYCSDECLAAADREAEERLLKLKERRPGLFEP